MVFSDVMQYSRKKMKEPWGVGVLVFTATCFEPFGLPMNSLHSSPVVCQDFTVFSL